MTTPTNRHVVRFVGLAVLPLLAFAGCAAKGGYQPLAKIIENLSDSGYLTGVAGPYHDDKGCYELSIYADGRTSRNNKTEDICQASRTAKAVRAARSTIPPTPAP